MIAVTIGNDEKVPVTLSPKDGQGNPAPIFGIPQWWKDSGPAGMDIAADGMSATLISQNVIDPDPANNVSIFKVRANATATPGERFVEETITLTVVQALAETLGAVAGIPVKK